MLMLRKVLSISLTVLLLTGSMNFTFATHYCGGHAVKSKLTFGNEQLDCGMYKNTPPCNYGANSIKAKSCCENDYISFELANDYQKEVINFELSTEFIFAFVYTHVEVRFATKNHFVAQEDNSPPPLIEKRQILFQSFLI